MRVGIATDHGGFGLKEELVSQLRAAWHEVVDFGAQSAASGDDYPNYVFPLVSSFLRQKVQVKFPLPNERSAVGSPSTSLQSAG